MDASENRVSIAPLNSLWKNREHDVLNHYFQTNQYCEHCRDLESTQDLLVISSWVWWEQGCAFDIFWCGCCRQSYPTVESNRSTNGKRPWGVLWVLIDKATDLIIQRYPTWMLRDHLVWSVGISGPQNRGTLSYFRPCWGGIFPYVQIMSCSQTRNHTSCVYMYIYTLFTEIYLFSYLFIF